MCRVPQGARGLKYDRAGYGESQHGRVPQGARGLKYRIQRNIDYRRKGRVPQGARGLKWLAPDRMGGTDGRAPRGARGLKFHIHGYAAGDADVAPRKGRVD